MAYVSPTWADGTAPALNAANLQAITNAVQDSQNLVFSNLTVASAAWTSNATYANYPFRAAVPLSGITAAYYASVVFDPDTAASGTMAAVCTTYAGGVYIYASEKPSTALTIPTIVCTKAVG